MGNTEIIRVLKENLGIDVSMDKFDVHLIVMTEEKGAIGRINKGHRVFKNSQDGFKKLLTWLKKRQTATLSTSCTIEFTGVYYENLAYFLKDNGLKVCMVIPSKAKKYMESLSKCSKTDKLDAQALAEMGLERELREWQPLSKQFIVLRTLTRERAELIKTKQTVSNRLHAQSKSAHKNQNSTERKEELLEMIEKQIIQIELEVEELIESDEPLKERIVKIISIPGVGLVTAVTIVAETNGFSSISSMKQLTSFAGLDVKIRESGKFKGKQKISKQGNSHIRRALHFPGISASQHCEPLKRVS